MHPRYLTPQLGGRSAELGLAACWLLVSLLVNGCASLQPGFEKPSVSVNSFNVLPASGMLPQFAIGLHIINPNRTALTLQGLVYSIEIEGHRVITGVANNLPVVAAYGEEDIEIQASADLFNSLRVLSSLIQQQHGQVNYRFSARLNVGNLLPDILISDQGRIDLRASSATQ